MRGARRLAKPAVGRPLDGRVRPQRLHSGDHSLKRARHKIKLRQPELSSGPVKLDPELLSREAATLACIANCDEFLPCETQFRNVAELNVLGERRGKRRTLFLLTLDLRPDATAQQGCSEVEASFRRRSVQLNRRWCGHCGLRPNVEAEPRTAACRRESARATG